MDDKYRGVGNPEKRDIAQFLFLDVASRWEAFCTSVFELELKRRYNVQPNVALRIMGDVGGRRYLRRSVCASEGAAVVM